MLHLSVSGALPPELPISILSARGTAIPREYSGQFRRSWAAEES
jgi:hypothetical protein